MGSTTISYAVLALAVGIACLLAGFFWGRSNLKSSLEKAVEQEHVSLDAREFAMRQQLDEAITEIARLRPLAEELGRVQDRLKHEQAKYERMKATFDATRNGGAAEEAAAQEEPAPPPQPAMTPQSADEAIQKLLQSLETLSPHQVPALSATAETAVSKVAEPAFGAEPVATAKPIPAVTRPPAVEAAKLKPEAPPSIQPRPSPPSGTPAPAPAPAKLPVQTNQPKASEAVDEWQEFARSLAALTDRKK